MTDFRVIPSIDELRRRPAVRALEAEFGADATVDALRAAASEVRAAIARGDGRLGADGATAYVESGAAAQLRSAFGSSLRPVINATGVVVHTNLGRAPLAAAAIDRVARIASGYTSLEYDLARGARGRRDVHAEGLLCRLTGADAAVVVNNNAAATMIVLAALAARREVIVSRGELVEIGGGFRVPDVMAQSGAILRVHPSNFRIEGFTERPQLSDLVKVGNRFNLPVAEDLGSGLLVSDTIGDEPAVRDSVAAGVDVCCFSGDKLLGGPQAGIIVGRTAMIDRIRTHPLMRALRVDKLTYAALEATLVEYAAGRAATTVPVQRMLATTADAIRARAEMVAARIGALAGWRATLVEGCSAVGGGSAPGVELPTWLVVVERDGTSPDALEASLRRLDPPIVARIDRERVVLDLRTVLPDQDAQLARLFASV